MGISPHVARIIVNEHNWRPIEGVVSVVSQETMFFNLEEAMTLLTEAGITVPASRRGNTTDRLTTAGQLSDREFFELLGVEQVKPLFHGLNAGPQGIRMLATELPSEFEQSVDFLLDGGTLATVFDPAAVVRNLARVLKPGGRLVSVSVASNHYGPYLIPTTFWLLDFFIENGFADCKIYILVHGDYGVNCFTPDLSRLVKELQQTDNFTSSHVMALVVVAEKGPSSTYHKIPVQHQFREDWDSFERNLDAIRRSKRPELARSTTSPFVHADGYLYVDWHGVKWAR